MLVQLPKNSVGVRFGVGKGWFVMGIRAYCCDKGAGKWRDFEGVGIW